LVALFISSSSHPFWYASSAEIGRDLFITETYVVVVFSIIVRGLTLGALTKRLLGKGAMQVGGGES